MHHERGANEDLFIVEVVDEENRPVPDGAPGQKLLVTNLYNLSQPLIRYEVSDMLTLSPEPCPCGRPFRLVQTLQGRSDDILELSGADGTSVQVHPIQLRSLMTPLPDVREYQFVHRGDGLHAYVVLQRDAPEGQATERIRAALTSQLESLTVRPGLVHVHVVDRVERDPGAAGKFKLVRSELPR